MKQSKFARISTFIFRHRPIFIIIAVLIIIGLIYAGYVLSLILSARKDKAPDHIGHLIVLGAQVWGEKPAYPSTQLQERLDTAYDYLIENPDTQVIVTGGQGSNEQEAEGDVMARYLTEKGIDENRITIESRSTSTIENIRFSLELQDIDTAVIVTNDYHLYRAKRTARQNGIETVYGLAAPSRSSSTVKSILREILAVGYYLIFSHD